MSSQDFLRTETVHIDEANRAATSSLQWFAENKNKKGSATHPITHNNGLSVHICGQDGFAAIAKDIAEAKESIDLVCWGFDPGMELVRSPGLWPRGETYGDLLISAAQRGVRVRLLVWYSPTVGWHSKNMPGHSNGTSPWYTPSFHALEPVNVSAKNSVQMLREHAEVNRHKREWNLLSEKAAAMAREEYCHSWYKAVFGGHIEGLSIRTRDGDSFKIHAALTHEAAQPVFTERVGMEQTGTHHQKPILIDFEYDSGRKAIGYVMGLNSVTDYWDTSEHRVENRLREQGGADTKGSHSEGVDGNFDFETLKPYRDYACRVEGGQALVALHENFERAWSRAGESKKMENYVCASPPAHLLRKAETGHSTIQIVRTQPEEKDFTIRDTYFNATRVATAGAGYLYVENQYFQYQEWSKYLVATRKKIMDGWKRNCTKIGKSLEDMPIMHVFVVIPAPEMAQMIPRTYETLAALGQQDGMTGQVKMIDQKNKEIKAQEEAQKNGWSVNPWGMQPVLPPSPPAVVDAANKTEKPSASLLESDYGLRVCVAVLNSSELDANSRKWRYREIYIHSKLLLVDDAFFTIGSANLNQRSMVVDSEINLATNDPNRAIPLRVNIWSQLTGGKYIGGDCKGKIVKDTYRSWLALMKKNKSNQKSGSNDSKDKQMTGFIVPLDDGRSSTLRLG